MKKIAITGNIACGKSQVEKFLSGKYPVYDTDIIAHKILDGLDGFEDLDIVTDGKIDRRKLGKIVFTDSGIKKRLENFIHPKVRDELYRIFELHKNDKVVFVSVPLLFEAHFENMFDAVIFVKADKDVRLRRLMKRNNLSRKDALIRINSQIEQDKKIGFCDYIIENNTTIAELETQTKDVLRQLDL